ncbi:MAG: cyclodeaminase/cyclohydrolase family protein [Solirubrobacterales bacterium]|nr:cyclodeaminase/cyclohydrolase family protein [Solirubrobacterales bacterium]HMT05533.1 cyclodeaminase/cyclohydrolase family protein [Solirubrobacterales bacterium]
MVRAESSEGVLEYSLGAILKESSAPEHSLASGSAAALSVALAASLACSVAKALDPQVEATGFIVQAESLRSRAVNLVGRNRDHYEAARQELEARIEDPGHRDHRIGEAMKESLQTLGLISGAGADTSELASNVARIAPDELKPDAVSATVLAESGSRVATVLIKANLLVTSGGSTLDSAEAELAAAVESSKAAFALLG